MSNESAPECLKHKDNRNVQVRLDYVLLYQSEVKAKIIRIIETWTNHKYAEWYKASADRKEQKQEPPQEDLWITMSYEQLTIFVYGTAQHDTIKQYVDELVASKDIQRRPNPEYPYGPPQYLLNRKKVQAGLDALEIPPNLFDLSPLFISPRKKRTPQEKYPQGGGIKPPRVGVSLPPGRGENTHPSNKHTKKHSELPKKEDTMVASPHVDATAPAFSENEYHFYGEKKHLAVNCLLWCRMQGGTCADYQDAIDNGWHEADTGKVPAIKLNGATQNDTPPATDLPADPARGLDHIHRDVPASGNGALEQIPLPARSVSLGPSMTLPPGEQTGGAASVKATEPRPPDEQTLSRRLATAEASDPHPAAPGRGAKPAAPGEDVTQASEKPKGKRKKPAEVQLSLAASQLKEWYEELRGTKASFSKRNVAALESLGKKEGADCKENFLNVVALLDIDPWFEKNGIGVDPYWIDRQWENKFIFLQRKKVAPLADKRATNLYTQASLDPERNKRNIERLRQAASNHNS